MRGTIIKGSRVRTFWWGLEKSRKHIKVHCNVVDDQVKISKMGKQYQDYKIRVFQNVCIHRGMKLIEKEMILKGAIRCPYHSWCYKQTGENCATPHISGPGINFHQNVSKEELSLIEVRSHVWRDIIFINVDGTAGDFEEINKPLINRLKEFNFLRRNKWL